jgi:hypothetical protein
MPTTITGTTIVTTAITGSSIRLTGGSQGLITPTTGSAPYYGIRAWAAVTNAGSATPTYTGYNISSISLVSTGKWDITFANPGYANVNSIGVLLTHDTNWNVVFGYNLTDSTTSKIRLDCRINNGTLYTLGYFTVACLW